MHAAQPEGSLRALLWDVDGTLAETEQDGHRIAFNRAFAEHGLAWVWDPSTYLDLLAVSGGRERLRWFLRQRERQDPPETLVEALQQSKQLHYRQLVEQGELVLRPGVRRLIAAAAAAGLAQAIVTTSGRSAVEALLASQLPDLEGMLAVRVCGEDVAAKKPDPEAYRLALRRLGLPAAQAVAIEDSGNGLRAALAGGLRCLVSLSAASAHEPRQLFAPASSLVDRLGDDGAPTTVLHGPPCAADRITLSYLEQLPSPP